MQRRIHAGWLTADHRSVACTDRIGHRAIAGRLRTMRALGALAFKYIADVVAPFAVYQRLRSA